MSENFLNIINLIENSSIGELTQMQYIVKKTLKEKLDDFYKNLLNDHEEEYELLKDVDVPHQDVCDYCSDYITSDMQPFERASLVFCSEECFNRDNCSHVFSIEYEEQEAHKKCDYCGLKIDILFCNCCKAPIELEDAVENDYGKLFCSEECVNMRRTCTYCDKNLQDISKIIRDGSDIFCNHKHMCTYAKNGDCKKYPKMSKRKLDYELDHILDLIEL